MQWGLGFYVCWGCKEKPSMYPTSRYLGLKVVHYLGTLGPGIYYLGTWTLREMFSG